MSITEFFKRLGAPLKNTRWSWGAVTADGTVFLRVWQGETKKIDAKNYVILTDRTRFEGKNDPGYEERLRHIELIRQGAPAYCIFCEPKDPTGIPREFKSFIDSDVFPASSLIEHEGNVWLEFGKRTPVYPLLKG